MKEILEVIAKFGAPLVITGIVLYGALRLLNIWLDRFQGQNCSRIEKREHMRLIEIRKSIDVAVNSILERLLLQTDGDRVYIMEFHNGGANIAGLPFLRMTNTYEFVSTGIAGLKGMRENIPLSMLPSLVAEITNKDHIVINGDSSDPVLSYFYSELIDAKNLATAVIARIVNSKGMIIGYLGLDFINSDKNFQRQSDVENLLNGVREIGALLSVNEKV